MSGCYYDRPPVPRKFQKQSNSSDFDSYGSHDRLDCEAERPFEDHRYSNIPLSINGLESVGALGPGNDSSMALSSMSIRELPHHFKDDDFDKAVEKTWDGMGNK